MKEKLYTIPINDAFDTDCECPICAMYHTLEKNAIEYTMGPSYMEDDIRAMTDELGFCEKHLKDVYNMENRLGFALVMKTHMDKVISEIEKRKNEPVKSKGLFKKPEAPSVTDYVKKLNCSCFVCSRVNSTFERYLDTIFVMYKTNSEFRDKYNSSKGFCTKHYGALMSEAPLKLSGTTLEDFNKVTTDLYLNNMKRVRDDVEWFINKFDHTYADAPWKNSKDALPRAMTKDGSILPDD